MGMSVANILLIFCLVGRAASLINSPMLTSQSVSIFPFRSQQRCPQSTRPTVSLRATPEDKGTESTVDKSAETRTPADGSLEKILGNLGPTGAKIGKGIDWFFDTSTIAGAQAWRLQEVPGEADSRRWRGDELGDVLQEQIESRKNDPTYKGAEAVDLQLGNDEAAFTDGLEAEYSMTDADLGSSLTARLAEMSFADSDAADRILTGAELALMCYRKYGLYHDMALKCDKFELVSDKRLVSVNIYYAYYGQLNPRFQYSEAEYLAKLDAIASAINQWQQAEYVRAFFQEKPTAYRGLPSRPRWDTAVSIRLNKSPTWQDSLVDDWFLQ